MDYAQGTFYGTAGQYECANADGGVLKWAQRIGGNLTDIAGRVGVDGHGGLFVTLSSQGGVAGATNAGGYDAYIAKYNESGYVLWTSVVGGSGNDTAQGLAVDSLGSAYMGVRSNSTGLVVKFDGCGKEAWRVFVGALATGSAFEVAAGPDAVYVLWTGGNGAFISQYGWNGTLRWVLNLGLNSSDVAMSVAAGGDGSGYVAGHTSRSVDGQPYSGAGWDVLVIRFNSSGVKVWTRILGTSQDEFARGAAVDGMGSVFVAGAVNASSGSSVIGNCSGAMSSSSLGVSATLRSSTSGTGGASTFAGAATSTTKASATSSGASSLVTSSVSVSLTKTSSPYITASSTSAAVTTSSALPGAMGGPCLDVSVGTWTSTNWAPGPIGQTGGQTGVGLNALIIKLAADGSML